MNQLSLPDVATIAAGVEQLRTAAVPDLLRAGKMLGCEDLFQVGDDARFSAKSGGNIFRQLSGFGYIAEGKGALSGDVLVVTRGTKTVFDGVSDLHVGLKAGPSGHSVHLGFQRIWECYAQDLRSFLQGKTPTHVHCVGHSLGGALAALNADYFSSLGLPVSLYTFGSPRVGLSPFSQSLTKKINGQNIYRVAHTTDPVTMVPAFPFFHVPDPGKSYIVERSGMIRMGEHFMDSYVGSIAGKSWSSLANAPVNMDWSDAVARAWLDAAKEGRSGVAMHSAASLNLIAHALRWLIRKALALGVISGGIMLGSAATAVDLLATLVDRSAELSTELADDVKTIMGAVMQFLGRSVSTIGEITRQFVAWAFEQLYGTICFLASRAMNGNNKRSY